PAPAPRRMRPAPTRTNRRGCADAGAGTVRFPATADWCDAWWPRSRVVLSPTSHRLGGAFDARLNQLRLQLLEVLELQLLDCLRRLFDFNALFAGARRGLPGIAVGLVGHVDLPN